MLCLYVVLHVLCILYVCIDIYTVDLHILCEHTFILDVINRVTALFFIYFVMQWDFMSFVI